MPRPCTIKATGAARWAAEILIGVAIDLGRGDEDTTGTWADSARRQLAEAETHIAELKRALSKLPTSPRAA